MSKITKSTIKSPRSILAAVFVLAMVGFGIYKLSFSSAAGPAEDFNYVAGSSWILADNPALTTVSDSVPYVGNPKVIQVAPGQKIDTGNLSEVGGIIRTRNCYEVRAVGSGVSATFTSGASSIDKVIGLSSIYQNLCVPYTAGTYPGYDIKNNSGGKLRVYQIRFHFNCQVGGTC